MNKQAVFLDRDGVLNIEAGYIHKLEDLNLITGVAKAVKKLNENDIFCCLVSNQSGPGRNYYTNDHVKALNDRLCALLKKEENAKLDAIYYCPYLSAKEGGINPEFTRYSTWRKPNTGMLIAASWEHNLDIKKSFMVGDKATDIDLAYNAGCRGILVQTGFGHRVLSGEYQHHIDPHYIASDLLDAVHWILSQNNL